MPKKTKTAAPRPTVPLRARVQESEELSPLALSLDGKTLAVVSIDEWVEEAAQQWEPQPVSKMHYRVTLENGRQVGIFRNMKTGSWYYQEGH